jgi:hypothetical protein
MSTRIAAVSTEPLEEIPKPDRQVLLPFLNTHSYRVTSYCSNPHRYRQD